MPTPIHERVLIVAPAWIGDAVMAQPLFMRLKERSPGLTLDALAPAWVAPVLRRMAEISEIIDNPFAHGELALSARYRLARQLSARGYRRAYVLPNSLKSALIPWLAGIPQRVGFTGESRYGLINQRHTLDPAALPKMVERFAQLAEHRRNEGLAAKTGIDAHDQDKIDPVHEVIEIIQRGCRIEDQTGLAAMLTNQRKTAVNMLRSLRMKGNKVGAGLGKIGNEATGRAIRCTSITAPVSGRIAAQTSGPTVMFGT